MVGWWRWHVLVCCCWSCSLLRGNTRMCSSLSMVVHVPFASRYISSTATSLPLGTGCRRRNAFFPCKIGERSDKSQELSSSWFHVFCLWVGLGSHCRYNQTLSYTQTHRPRTICKCSFRGHRCPMSHSVTPNRRAK